MKSLWSYPNKILNFETETTVVFIQDLSDGSCLVECSCGKEYTLKDVNGEPTMCVKCHKELYYPRCDW